MTVAVEDRAALCGNGQQPDALILRALGVISAVGDLQIIEAHAEHGEQYQHHELNRAHAPAQIL